jgi:hypothetical protein
VAIADTIHCFKTITLQIQHDLMSLLTASEEGLEIDNNKKNKQKQTPWSESASELYRPSDRRLSAK